MPAYKVVNGTYHAHGTRYRPGDVVADLLPSELRAHPDRFTLATDAEAAAYQAKHAALLTASDPEDLAHVAAERAALTAQIAALQQKLSALPGGDPMKASVEHAPVDPITRERYEQEQAALAAALHAEQDSAAKAKTPARSAATSDTPSTPTPPRSAGGGSSSSSSSSGSRT